MPGELFATLDERKPGTATLSSKLISICDVKLEENGRSRYPAFPDDSNNPWDAIENGRWNSISRYWGNSSAGCASWAVAALTTADTSYVKKAGFTKKTRARYQSKPGKRRAHCQMQDRLRLR